VELHDQPKNHGIECQVIFDTGLRVLAEASRSEPANLRFDVLVTERRNHMTIVELWRDADAQAAHLGEPHNRRFRTDLLPARGALYDERLYRGL
jgi:quinol monooxygenase YgiN